MHSTIDIQMNKSTAAEETLKVAPSTPDIQPNIASVKAPIARKLYLRGSEAGST